MVETSLFPRPHFTSFLQSDDNVDPLSYYEYQRLQRLQKVARLQERRSKSHEPGYKKPLVHVQHSPLHAASHVTSRQIFTKPPLLRPSATSETVPVPPPKKVETTLQSQSSLFSDAKKHAQREEGRLTVPLPTAYRRPQKVVEEREAGGGGRENSGGGREMVKHAQTERLPGTDGNLKKFSRPVKSATVQGMQRGASYKPHLLPRPKTAAVGTRDVGTLTTAVSFSVPGKREGEKKEDEEGAVIVDVDGEDVIEPPPHTMESNSLLAERSKENLAQAYHWTTSTQRAYNEVGWADSVPPGLPPPPSTVEQFPDPVSQRLTFRRYNSCPEPWQVYGPEWDYVQTRFGDYRPLDPVNFCAPTRHNQYIPGYTGFVSETGAVDHQFLSRLLVRRLTPRPTRISRRANIPGYTGHTHWTRMEPAHSDLMHPNPLSTARAHREIPLEEDVSVFRRTSPMSKTVTLVSPYNPFNKIEY